MRSSYYYTPKVKVHDGEKANDYFDVHDDNYLDGTTKERPPDFDLHLALYIFAREGMPESQLEPIVQWVRDNRMVGNHYYFKYTL